MATKPKPEIIKARLTLPTSRALWFAAKFAAGEFAVVKISPPMPTRHDEKKANVYFDILLEEYQ